MESVWEKQEYSKNYIFLQLITIRDRYLRSHRIVCVCVCVC